MAYWLSNTSTLLFLLQRSLRTAPRKPPTPTTLFGRMTQVMKFILFMYEFDFVQVYLISIFLLVHDAI